MIYHASKVPPGVQVRCQDKSLARQSEAEGCDINVIMKRYEKTGLLPQVVGGAAFFADVSELGDYRTVVENIRLAEAAFGQLPADLRSRFRNDVAEFLDFVSDPANAGELVKLGLVEDPGQLELLPEDAAAKAAAEAAAKAAAAAAAEAAGKAAPAA